MKSKKRILQDILKKTPLRISTSFDKNKFGLVLPCFMLVRDLEISASGPDSHSLKKGLLIDADTTFEKLVVQIPFIEKPRESYKMEALVFKYGERILDGNVQYNYLFADLLRVDSDFKILGISYSILKVE